MPDEQADEATTTLPTSIPVAKIAAPTAADAAEAHLDGIDLDAAAAAVAKLTKTLPGL